MTHVDRITNIPASWPKSEGKFKVQQQDKNKAKDKEPNGGSKKREKKSGHLNDKGDSDQSHIDEYA